MAFALGLLVILSGSAAGQRQAGSSRADYRIEARLDGLTKRLAGELWLTWTNKSGEAVSDLWFHLYLNAFSNNRSTHLHEAGGKLRDVEVEEGWGWSQVTAVEVAGAGEGGGYTDIFPSFRYRRPDDGRQDDRTVFSVDLPRPVEPGSQLTVRIEQPGGKGMTFKPTVLKAEPAQELRWIGRLMFPGIFDGEHHFIIDEQEDKRVRFVQGERFTGILVPLMAPIGLFKNTQQGFEAMNQALKARAEAQDLP